MLKPQSEKLSTQSLKTSGNNCSIRRVVHGKIVAPDTTIGHLRKDDPMDAGYDLFAAKDMWIFPFMVRRVPVNAIVELPECHFGRVTGRSSMTDKGIVTIEGTIDSGFRDVFHAHTYKIGFLPYKIKKGDKIAQMIVIPYREVAWTLTTKENLTPTRRGNKGFGSTGKR